jgi:hypothetical protein
MRRLILFAATGMLALAVVVPASGDTQPAAGTFTEGPETITGEQFADGNDIVTLTREVVFTGTYDGVGQADERIVIHKDGSTNVHIVVAFTGLACGQPATLEFLIEGQGTLNELGTGAIAGNYTLIDNGRFSSRTIRGAGKFEGVAGVGGTYEGDAHCDTAVP